MDTIISLCSRIIRAVFHFHALFFAVVLKYITGIAPASRFPAKGRETDWLKLDIMLTNDQAASLNAFNKIFKKYTTGDKLYSDMRKELLLYRLVFNTCLKLLGISLSKRVAGQ